MAEGIFVTIDQANAIGGLLLSAVQAGAIPQSALDPYRVLVDEPNITVVPKVLALTSYVQGTTPHVTALCDDGSLWDLYLEPDATNATWHALPTPSTVTATVTPGGSP